jgi:fido (protein-threonine AMPylation protein)
MVKVWEPITDLPKDWAALSDGELGPLLKIWNDQRADLEQSGVLAGFTQRLAREWSIETGQIEGVYDIDCGITQTLIERGINADLIGSQPGQKPPELIAAIIQDHADVLEGLFQFVKGARPLSKSYIHELHAALLKHQETTLALDQFGNLFESKLIKGRYKQYPNNPKKPDGSVHQYCPPEQVEPEMERLLALHENQTKQEVPVEVQAVWLHHRFAQIHPYQDGNGRVARALASLIFMKDGWFPVVVTRDDRPRYIDALEVADEGDLRSLVSFFVDVQKRALFQATQAAADVQQVHTVDEAIAAAKRVLTGPGKSLDPSIWLTATAKDTANRLMDIASARLSQIAKSLGKEIGENNPEFRFNTTTVSLVPVSTHLAYRPNTVDYDQSRSLFISRQSSTVIGISAHAIGSKFRGLIGALMVIQKESGEISPASKEPFQINYAEPYESAERRFRPWLEESLVNALTLWRKSL